MGNEKVVLKTGGSLHNGFVSERVGGHKICLDNPEIQFMEVVEWRLKFKHSPSPKVVIVSQTCVSLRQNGKGRICGYIILFIINNII